MSEGPLRYRWLHAVGVLVADSDPAVLQRRVVAARSAMRHRDQTRRMPRPAPETQHDKADLQSRLTDQRVPVRAVSDTRPIPDHL